MDEKLNILLNSGKNIKSINVDGSMKVELSNKLALINEYNIRNVLSVTELFELERQETQIYRIYGRIEYLSLLNGLRSTYSNFVDFFNPFGTTRIRRGLFKDIFNSFDFYLVRPAETGYTQNINNASQYNRFFKVVATPNQFELFKAGFASNVFDEQTYAFNFSIDVDISELTDEFGMPITELFLYVQYKKSEFETLSYVRWSNNGVQSNSTFNTMSLNVGDYVRTSANLRIGDYVEYARQGFWQTQLTPQIFRIGTPIVIGNVNGDNLSRITLTSTPCQMTTEVIDGDGSIFRASYKTLTFSISQIQPNDITIFYEIMTEIEVDFTTPQISSITGSTTILAGQRNRILTNIPCRFESISNLNTGGWETTITNIYYSLITNTIGNNGNLSQPTPINVIWKYNPFIPIRLRYFEDYLSRANINSTSYDVSQSIPEYATHIGNGNYVWREIMPEGYTDPLTGIGTNHPFVNKRRYVFSSIVLDIIPDLDDETTLNLFQKLWFDRNSELINTRPINDINQINKPCL